MATYRNGPQTSFAAVDNGKPPKRSPAGYYLCSCSCSPHYHSYFYTKDICTHVHFNWATMACRTLRISCAQFGMAKHVFCKLCAELQLQHGLSDGKYVFAEEKLDIFLHFAQTGASLRMLQERFQQSGETISK